MRIKKIFRTFAARKFTSNLEEKQTHITDGQNL